MRKIVAVAVSALIVFTACLVSSIPGLADDLGIWIKTDGVNEITPALTDNEASEFVHEIQSWGAFGSQTFDTAEAALNWVNTNIANVSDGANYGVAEAWANPEQTLDKGSGDCEDMAFLLASLLKWHTNEVDINEDEVYALCGFLLLDEEFYAWVFWFDASETDWHQLDPTTGGHNHFPLPPKIGTLWLNDERVFGFLSGYYPEVPTPIPGYDFARISEGGFIDSESEGRHNSYAWSMEVLPTPNADYLYVGCNRDFIYPLIKSLDFTDEEIEEIFEGDIPIPVPIEPGSPVPDSRGRIFRCEAYDPDIWEIAYTSPIVEHPNPAIPYNVYRYSGYRSMKTFTDVEGETALYVATTNLPAFPCHILKFGQDYVPGDEPDIVGEFAGVSSIRSLIEHNGKLYTSSFGGTGIEIWESDNPALGNWIQVAQSSDFPAGGIPPVLRGISTMVSFNSCLYAFVGVGNVPPGIYPALPGGIQGGFWVYKSASPAIGNWTETMRDGAGNHWNEGVSHATVFGDHVYAGTAVAVVAHFGRLVELEEDPRFTQYLSYLLQNWKGGDVFRFDSDDIWELVIGDPSKNALFPERVGDHGTGFDNPYNAYLWWTGVHENELYVGTFDVCVLGKYATNFLTELYPELGGFLSELDLAEGLEPLMGADLWVTEDGTCWNPATFNGFGNMYNYGVRSLLSTDEGLFVGTANPFYGGEVWWKTPPEGQSTNATGMGRDSYGVGNGVYVAGSGFKANVDVDVYIVTDRAWTNGDRIPDDVRHEMTTLTTDEYGNLGPICIWHPPLTPGEYDLVFDVNRNGYYDTGTDWVNDPNHPGFVVRPGAAFSATPTEGDAPLRVQFTDESVGATSWSWDFGDGKTSTEQNPTHTYMRRGKYTVALTVRGPSGKDTATASITVVPMIPTEKAAPSKFSASYLYISPEQVLPNQQVEISINIANHGEKKGSHTVALYIDGYLEQSQTVGVSPGSTKSVVFRITKSNSGTYQVSLEGQQGQFTVIALSSAPTTAHFTGGLGTGGIIAIVVIALVLIGSIVFLVVRRE